MKQQCDWPPRYQFMSTNGAARHLKDGTTLYLDGEKVLFAGEHNGNVWVTWKRENIFIRKSDERITRLRLEP